MNFDLYRYLAISIIFAIITFKKPIWGLSIIVLLIPLHTYKIGSSTIVRMAAIPIFGSWILYKMTRKESFNHIFKNNISKPIILFVFLCSIAALWSDYQLWRVSIFTYFQLFLFVFMSIDIIQKKTDLLYCLYSLGIGAVISSYIVLDQYLSHRPAWTYWSRAEGGMGNPNLTASSFVVIFPFFVYLALYRKKWQKYIGIAGIVMLLIGIGITVSRTVIILLMLVVLTQFLMVRKPNKKFMLLFLCVITIFAVVPFIPVENVEYRFGKTFTNNPQTAYGGRFYLMEKGIDRVLENPLLGRGIGTSEKHEVLHNLYLEIASQLGIIGLIILLLICFQGMKYINHSVKIARKNGESDFYHLNNSIKLSFIIYLLYSLSASSETQRLLWFLFALSYCAFRVTVTGLLSRE